MFTSTTITVSPLQIFVGGICLGAGAYAGRKACQRLELAAAASLGKLKSRMKEKEKSAEATPTSEATAEVNK
jgi:hypothetical protein